MTANPRPGAAALVLQRLRAWPPVIRFLGVGGAAAATHLLVVAVLVEAAALPPLAANIGAFLVAFWVSYSGHAGLTFVGAGFRHRQALPRFFAVAAGSFVLNEALYFALLHYAHWNYLAALFVVLVAVAVLTFVCARFWAFARATH